jgi:hypothetical protein
MQRVRMSGIAAMLVFVAAGVHAQSFTTIHATPLEINVGADGSFQIYNTAVPGVGQVFPTSTDLADMGVFAFIDGELHAPDFASHGTTATTSLGSYTPWESVSLSPRALGQGIPSDPFVVSALLAAPNSDVRVNLTTSYVRGDNFFRLRTHVYSATNTTHEVDIYLGADIFLAGSDNGFFVSVPALNAVGGRSCDPEEGSYNILLIPITPANSFTASHFGDVWRQIGEGVLSNSSEGGSCIDNGAAIKWEDVMRSGTSIELNAAVSFGEIPSAANFHGFTLTASPSFITLAPGESAQVTVASTHNATLDFNAAIRLFTENLPPGVAVTFDKPVIDAPGTGSAQATITLGSDVFPQLYSNLGIFGSGGNETHAAFLGLDVLCTPPKILSIDQPQSTTVRRGQPATLKVTPSAGGLYTYQWYQGHAPLIGSPIANSNSGELTTPPINEVTQFWVRVTNPCGSANSLTATVVPTN